MSLKAESKAEMAEKITLSVLTKFIKPYDGNRESLPAFLTNCDNAMSLASAEQKNVLCKFIIAQLEGKAQVACSLKSFSEWEEIKSYLKSTFGEKKHSCHLLMELQNCKQLSGEDVTKYSLRIEHALTRILSEIHYSCRESKELPGRTAAMEELALNTFMLGLNTSISTIVRCRNPATLNDAVQHAIEEEKLYNLSKTGTKFHHPTCSTCHRSGHTSSECFKKGTFSKPKPNFQKSFHVNPNFNNKRFPRNPVICNYCKNVGHTISFCRKRQFNMTRRENDNPAQRDQTPRPSSSHAVKFCETEKSGFDSRDENLN